MSFTIISNTLIVRNNLFRILRSLITIIFILLILIEFNLWMFCDQNMLLLSTTASKKLTTKINNKDNVISSFDSNSNIKSSNNNQNKKEEYLKFKIHPKFYEILTDNRFRFFLLEPYLLGHMLRDQMMVDDEYEEFKWRYDLSPEFRYQRNSLTVGLFIQDLLKDKYVNN